MIVECSIRAFIPRDVPGALVRVGKGPYAGHTAVPLPYAAYGCVPWKVRHLPVGYVGDNRDSSLARAASARMVSKFNIDVTRGRLVGQPSHSSDPSVEIALKTGQVTNVMTSSTARRRWGELRELPHSRPAHRVWCIDLAAAGSDPLVWCAAFFPIRMNGCFVVERIRCGEGLVVVKPYFFGKLTAFPAFEGIARIDGVAKFVFKKPVEPGRTVSSLMRGAVVDVRGCDAVFNIVAAPQYN